MTAVQPSMSLYPVNIYGTSVAVCTPTRRIEIDAQPTVSTARYSDALYSAQRVLSEALYAGMRDTTLPMALAACYSVPNDAPLAMAVDNIGCSLQDGDAAQYEADRARYQRAIRSMAR